MSVTQTETAFPFVLARVRVDAVELLSPSFVRLTFAGEQLRDFGTPGQTYDQRIKLIFPNPGEPLVELGAASAEWYQQWLALPETSRGAMRTYSIRDLRRAPDGTTLLIVDFVLHLAQGATGPASSWAASAAPGDELLVFGPRRGELEGVGIEYHPGSASRVLLVGDETAAPAIARMIEDLGRDPERAPQINAFIEVPEANDILPVDSYPGVHLEWLPRNGAPLGSRLIPGVLQHLGARSDGALEGAEAASGELGEEEGEELVWETPQFSRLGEQLAVGENHAESYFWIAGESGVVTALRRHLVRDLGIDRGQVAFMGYWRRGVAMRG